MPKLADSLEQHSSKTPPDALCCCVLLCVAVRSRVMLCGCAKAYTSLRCKTHSRRKGEALRPTRPGGKQKTQDIRKSYIHQHTKPNTTLLSLRGSCSLPAATGYKPNCPNKLGVTSFTSSTTSLRDPITIVEKRAATLLRFAIIIYECAAIYSAQVVGFYFVL